MGGSSQAFAGADWFRSLAETASVAIFVYRGFRFEYVNRASCQLSGYSAEELLRMGPGDLIHPEHWQRAREEERRRRDGEPGHGPFEVGFRHREGGERWASFSTAVFTYRDRRFGVGLAVDVTARRRAEAALRESHEWLELAQRAGRCIAWEWLPESDLLIVSAIAAELFGISGSSMPGRQMIDAVPQEDRSILRGALRETLATGEPFAVHHRIRLGSDDVRWLSVQGQAVADGDGQRRRVIGVSADVTSHYHAEEELAAERERAEATLESLAEGVIRTDADGRVDYMNPAAEQLTGRSLTEARGRPLGEVYTVTSDASRAPNRVPAGPGPMQGLEAVHAERALLHRADGAEFAVRESITPLRGRRSLVVGSVVVFTDITQLRGLEREMAYLASHDPLTGLPNRRSFEVDLSDALGDTPERQHALCFLDLDDFKMVNDTCGHAAGDELLRQISAVLQSALRHGDLVARLGGDEFALLLRDCPSERARDVAAKILGAIAGFRFPWREHLFDVAASIGVVPLGRPDLDPAGLMAAADSACYVAKDRGRNQIHVYQPGDAEVAARHSEMQWIQRINKAMEEARFRLYGQTIEPLRGNGRGLIEILLRMVDEDGTVIAPGQFIPAAERYHLMPGIDRWVVETALRTVARSPGDGVDYTINLSGQTLGADGFLEFVRDRLRASGVPARQICFEITETAAISNLARARQLMSALRRDGCRFILDDFGTGLSSFAYLRTLPVDFLKIDGSLVQHIAHDPVQREMVAAIHRVGQLMGIATIGEAVESPEALDTLRELGVGFAQGFWVALPCPLSAGGAGDPLVRPAGSPARA